MQCLDARAEFANVFDLDGPTPSDRILYLSLAGTMPTGTGSFTVSVFVDTASRYVKGSGAVSALTGGPSRFCVSSVALPYRTSPSQLNVCGFLVRYG